MEELFVKGWRMRDGLPISFSMRYCGDHLPVYSRDENNKPDRNAPTALGYTVSVRLSSALPTAPKDIKGRKEWVDWAMANTQVFFWEYLQFPAPDVATEHQARESAVSRVQEVLRKYDCEVPAGSLDPFVSCS